MPWNYNALTSLDKSNKCKENSHAIENQILLDAIKQRWWFQGWWLQGWLPQLKAKVRHYIEDLFQPSEQPLDHFPSP